MEWGDTIYTGLFLQNTERPALDQLEPVLEEGGGMARRPLGLSAEQANKIIARMM